MTKKQRRLLFLCCIAMFLLAGISMFFPLLRPGLLAAETGAKSIVLILTAYGALVCRP